MHIIFFHPFIYFFIFTRKRMKGITSLVLLYILCLDKQAPMCTHTYCTFQVTSLSQMHCLLNKVLLEAIKETLIIRSHLIRPYLVGDLGQQLKSKCCMIINVGYLCIQDRTACKVLNLGHGILICECICYYIMLIISCFELLNY